MHTQGLAVDINRNCINSLRNNLTNDTTLWNEIELVIPNALGDNRELRTRYRWVPTIGQYVNRLPSCEAKWGGEFSDYDPVHFKREDGLKWPQ